MPKLNRKQKKEWAEILFLKTAFTQREIAAKVDVAEKTLSAWVNDSGWKEKKSRLIITRAEELNRIYEQLSHLNDHIMSRDEKERFANNKEADIISKLTSAARNLETQVSIANIVDVFQDFTDWLRMVDITKAQEIIDWMDGYIKHKMK